ARPHLEMYVREVSGLAWLRVDDDQRPSRILGDLLQDDPRPREAMGLPRVLAPEHRDLRMLVVASGVTARLSKELAVGPELARLLLRQRVRRIRHAQRAAGRGAVAAAEAVALADASVIADRSTSVNVTKGGQHGDDVVE